MERIPIDILEKANFVHSKLLGERIRLARVKKDWSQEDLAFNARVSHRTIYYLETGQQNITMKTLLYVVMALDLNLKDLF